MVEADRLPSTNNKVGGGFAMPYNPEVDGSFGAWMRGGAPLGQGRTVDVITDDPTWLTRDQVVEETREDGSRLQHRLDQLGHIVSEETTAKGHQRRHVKINLR